MDKIKVLLFAANPRGTAPLDLSREFREIDEEVRLSTFRNAVELILVPGTRPVDLLRKLNENQPQVVHFSSHGNPDEILLESGEAEAPDAYGLSIRSGDERDMKKVRPDEVESGGVGQGQSQVVSKSALVNVLRSCNEGNLRLVVLNACSTRPQAEALTEVVDCVISMNRTITDRAAIKFAASFYGALAFGRSVQKAFDQGVARLSAEGIAEAETPALLVRAGVDAAQLVLVGSTPSKAATPSPEAPFIVPFPRNGEFVGRDGDLNKLRSKLSGPGSGPVGIRPAGLTGMGGIGKTQLVVEYVYRHRDDYPEGIFWIDAAGPLVEGFARLATDHRLKWAEIDRPRDEQIRAAFEALNCRPHALLVLDNLPDPAAIALHLLPGCIPEDLRCTLLFTTRRHDLGRFTGIEITVLPEEPALHLLLRHPSRCEALAPSHADHEHARAIARMLGRHPMALEMAGENLGKYRADITLESYREGLRSDGALATLDADAAELTEADLRRVHDPAVAATIGEQWASLRDEPARLLLRVASLFSESIAVPITRLGLLAGLDDEARPGRRSPLRRAVQHLDDACLVERLEADQIRLHPLIREFATDQTPAGQVEDFHRQCLARASAALEHFPTLESLDAQRGVDGLQEDVIAVLGLCPPSASEIGDRVQAVLRLLQREAHNFCGQDAKYHTTLFAQQVRNRAVQSGIVSLQSDAAHRLVELGQPHFQLQWTASRESPDLIRTLTGHGDWVNAVTLFPDGRHALSGSEDSTLRCWNVQTGQLLRTFAGHEAGVNAVALVPDARHVLSASRDRTLKYWGLETGQLIRTLIAHEDVVTTIAISHDARHAVSGSRDRTIRIWDLQTGQLLRTLAGHKEAVSTVSVSSDGRHALSGSRDCTLKLWDLATGQLLRSFTGHCDRVSAVAITAEGRLALSGSSDQTLKLWDLQTGQLLRTLAGHRDGVNAVAVSPDAHRALSGSDDRMLRLWNLQTGELVRTFAGHEHALNAVAISADGRYGLSGSDDRTVKLWDLVARQSQPITTGHESQVIAVAVSPDGRHAVSGSFDRTLRHWDVATGALLHCLEGHETAANALAILADGRHALVGSYDGKVRLIDLQSGGLRCILPGHKDSAGAVTLMSDQGHAPSDSVGLAPGLWDGQIGEDVYESYPVLRAHDSRQLQEMLLLLNQFHPISAVAVTFNGRFVVSGSYNGTLYLWDRRTGEFLRYFVGHTDAVCAVAVAPDDCHAFSGSADHTLRLWRIATGELLHTFTEHEGAVTAVAICPDGRQAVSGSRDRTLRLWDLQERVCRATVPLQGAVLAVALASHERTLVVGDRVGNVYCFKFII